MVLMPCLAPNGLGIDSYLQMEAAKSDNPVTIFL